MLSCGKAGLENQVLQVWVFLMLLSPFSLFVTSSASGNVFILMNLKVLP